MSKKCMLFTAVIVAGTCFLVNDTVSAWGWRIYRSNYGAYARYGSSCPSGACNGRVTVSEANPTKAVTQENNEPVAVPEELGVVENTDSPTVPEAPPTVEELPPTDRTLENTDSPTVPEAPPTVEELPPTDMTLENTETTEPAEQAVVPGSVPQTRREARQLIAEEFEVAVVERVNSVRVAAGLNPLTIDEKQCFFARQHSQRMAGWGMLQHATGYAECIAQANGQAEHIVNLWLNSPAHRSIIMSAGRTRVAVGRFGQWHTLRVW